MTRSRRAGLPRDVARQQPLYARVLGLQYLAPSGFLCFVFLEGAVALGVLLALAELVSWWGVLVLPLTVAAMVKLNDVVAGALIRTPSTGPAGASRGPSGRRARAPGRGPGGAAGTSGFVPGASRGAAGASDDAAGAFGGVAVAFGGVVGASGGVAGASGGASGGAAGAFGGASGGASGGGASGGSVGAETVRLPATMISQVGGPIIETPPALRPATARRSAAETVVPELREDDDTWRGQTGALDASALNGPPTARQWNEELDDHYQRARQSAARRYE